MAEVGEHYRRTDDTPDATYRVVGATDEVTLLRVTDADGRRVHSGKVVRVPPGTLADEFEPADDPDAGFSPVSAVRNALQGLYWNIRKFL